MAEKREFTQEKLLLVEGNDDKQFFIGALDRLGLKGIRVYQYGGKATLKAELIAIAKSATFRPNVRSLGITRDADSQGVRPSTDSILNSLHDAGLAVSQTSFNTTGRYPNLRCSAYVLSNSSGYGALEDMLLEAIAGNWQIECVDEFWDCLQLKMPKGSPKFNQEKTTLAAFLAAQRDVARHYGVAIQRGHIDIDHPVFDELKQFLQNL